MRLTVYFSYVQLAHTNDYEDITGDALEGLVSCAKKYKSGTYKPSSLLQFCVRSKITRNRAERRNLFNLSEWSITIWRKYERKIEQWFAEGNTNPILQERYTAFVELGGSEFAGKARSVSLFERYRRFAAAEKSYFASFGRFSDEHRQTLDTVIQRSAPSPDPFMDPAELICLHYALKQVFSTLTPIEAEVLNYRTGLEG